MSDDAVQDPLELSDPEEMRKAIARQQVEIARLTRDRSEMAEHAARTADSVEAMAGAMEELIRRLDLATSAPIEMPTLYPKQPWTTDAFALRLHGKDGKQAKWIALALVAAAILVLGAYRLGFTASDFRPGSKPSPSLELPVESHGDSG